MTDDPLNELGRRIRSLVNSLPSEEELKAKRMRLPKSAVPLHGETLDRRLRTIDDRSIDASLLARVLDRDLETIYRRVKAGMPCFYEGRNLRFFLPQVADWLLERSEERKRLLHSKQALQENSSGRESRRQKEMMEMKK